MLTIPQGADRTDAKTLIVLILLVLLAYWKIIPDRGYTYFVGQDSAGQYYPWTVGYRGAYRPFLRHATVGGWQQGCGRGLMSGSAKANLSGL